MIAVVLLAAYCRPGSGRRGRVRWDSPQAFALLGTLVGVFFIAIGLGPGTLADIAYHLAIVAVLVWGLVIAKRAPADVTKRQA